MADHGVRVTSDLKTPTTNVESLTTDVGLWIRRHRYNELMQVSDSFYDIVENVCRELYIDSLKLIPPDVVAAIGRARERESHPIARRVLDHYLHTAMAASQRFSPSRSPLRLSPPPPDVLPADVAGKEQAMSWFDAEVPVLLALINYADANGFDPHAWQIPWTLGPFFNRRSRFLDYAATQATALAAAQRLGDTVALAHTHYLLGNAQAHLEEYEAASPNIRRALDLFRELGDRANEGMVLNGSRVAGGPAGPDRNPGRPDGGPAPRHRVHPDRSGHRCPPETCTLSRSREVTEARGRSDEYSCAAAGTDHGKGRLAVRGAGTRHRGPGRGHGDCCHVAGGRAA